MQKKLRFWTRNAKKIESCVIVIQASREDFAPRIWNHPSPHQQASFFTEERIIATPCISTNLAPRRKCSVCCGLQSLDWDRSKAFMCGNFLRYVSGPHVWRVGDAMNAGFQSAAHSRWQVLQATTL